METNHSTNSCSLLIIVLWKQQRYQAIKFLCNLWLDLLGSAFFDPIVQENDDLQTCAFLSKDTSSNEIWARNSNNNRRYYSSDKKTFSMLKNKSNQNMMLKKRNFTTDFSVDFTIVHYAEFLFLKLVNKYKFLKRILENTSTRSLYLVDGNSRLFSLVTWKDQVITFLGESHTWQLNLQRLPTYLEVKLLGQQVYFKWTHQYSTRSPIFDYTKKKLWRVHYLLMQMEVSLPFFKNNRLMSRKNQII